MTLEFPISFSRTHPTLPTELERDIFEIAAWAFPDMRLPLQLVAKRTRIWIEPIVYHSLMFSQDLNTDVKRRLSSFLEQMKVKPASFLHKNVKALFVEEESEPETFSPSTVAHLLESFTGLRWLLLGITSPLPPEIYTIIANRPLKHVIIGDSTFINAFLAASLSIPNSLVSQTLTHTHFANIASIRQPFDHLKQLTHVSLSSEDFDVDSASGESSDEDVPLSDSIAQILALPNLLLCQVLYDPEESEEKIMVESFLKEHKLTDERLVVVAFEGLPETSDWQDFFLFNGLWKEGERLLAEKRRLMVSVAVQTD
ncbi:hypothetical protein DL96DRAFT_1676252 [Flagelloscypha sp. PMI_526]|nr:hypothetical protein DL96DRAFT_1676252 [Flagelloscypha sp. PMI_526]